MGAVLQSCKTNIKLSKTHYRSWRRRLGTSSKKPKNTSKEQDFLPRIPPSFALPFPLLQPSLLCSVLFYTAFLEKALDFLHSPPRQP
jgi:hypothetical protein